MRLSQYFLPLLKENPSEAQIVSHRLMLRAGMIRQSASGIYTWLPLGFRVLKKVERIVREEQDAAGAQELLMPTIQPAELWQESGRYKDYGEEMLRFPDRHKRELLYGPTNEELITDIFRNGVKSYRDLPKNLYHIQWKFRDEVRPRFGVMRGREFLMKDTYSFDLDKAGAIVSYFKMFVAYMKTFKRMGLAPIPVRAATGPIGGDLTTNSTSRPTPAKASSISTATSNISTNHHRSNEPDHPGSSPQMVRRHRRETRSGRVRRGCPKRAAARRAASKWASCSISAPNIPSR